MMEIKNLLELIEKYNYKDTSYIFNRIKNKGLIALPEDYDILNMIVLWKINRTVNIASETIEYLNSVAKTITDPKTALNSTDAKMCFEELLNCKGIRLPMASTIFHFYQPKAFPIIDERAYYQVFSEKLYPNSGWATYSKYLKACIEICHENIIPFDKVDKVLYQLDIEKGRSAMTYILKQQLYIANQACNV